MESDSVLFDGSLWVKTAGIIGRSWICRRVVLTPTNVTWFTTDSETPGKCMICGRISLDGAVVAALSHPKYPYYLEISLPDESVLPLRAVDDAGYSALFAAFQHTAATYDAGGDNMSDSSPDYNAAVIAEAVDCALSQKALHVGVVRMRGEGRGGEERRGEGRGGEERYWAIILVNYFIVLPMESAGLLSDSEPMPPEWSEYVANNMLVGCRLGNCIVTQVEGASNRELSIIMPSDMLDVEACGVAARQFFHMPDNLADITALTFTVEDGPKDAWLAAFAYTCKIIALPQVVEEVPVEANRQNQQTDHPSGRLPIFMLSNVKISGSPALTWSLRYLDALSSIEDVRILASARSDKCLVALRRGAVVSTIPQHHDAPRGSRCYQVAASSCTEVGKHVYVDCGFISFAVPGVDCSTWEDLFTVTAMPQSPVALSTTANDGTHVDVHIAPVTPVNSPPTGYAAALPLSPPLWATAEDVFRFTVKELDGIVDLLEILRCSSVPLLLQMRDALGSGAEEFSFQECLVVIEAGVQEADSRKVLGQELAEALLVRTQRFISAFQRTGLSMSSLHSSPNRQAESAVATGMPRDHHCENVADTPHAEAPTDSGNNIPAVEEDGMWRSNAKRLPHTAPPSEFADLDDSDCMVTVTELVQGPPLEMVSAQADLQVDASGNPNTSGSAQVISTVNEPYLETASSPVITHVHAVIVADVEKSMQQNTRPPPSPMHGAGPEFAPRTRSVLESPAYKQLMAELGPPLEHVTTPAPRRKPPAPPAADSPKQAPATHQNGNVHLESRSDICTPPASGRDVATALENKTFENAAVPIIEETADFLSPSVGLSADARRPMVDFEHAGTHADATETKLATLYEEVGMVTKPLLPDATQDVEQLAVAPPAPAQPSHSESSAISPCKEGSLADIPSVGIELIDSHYVESVIGEPIDIPCLFTAPVGIESIDTPYLNTAPADIEPLDSPFITIHRGEMQPAQMEEQVHNGDQVDGRQLEPATSCSPPSPVLHASLQKVDVLHMELDTSIPTQPALPCEPQTPTAIHDASPGPRSPSPHTPQQAESVSHELEAGSGSPRDSPVHSDGRSRELTPDQAEGLPLTVHRATEECAPPAQIRLSSPEPTQKPTALKHAARTPMASGQRSAREKPQPDKSTSKKPRPPSHVVKRLPKSPDADSTPARGAVNIALPSRGQNEAVLLDRTFSAGSMLATDPGSSLLVPTRSLKGSYSVEGYSRDNVEREDHHCTDSSPAKKPRPPSHVVRKGLRTGGKAPTASGSPTSEPASPCASAPNLLVSEHYRVAYDAAMRQATEQVPIDLADSTEEPDSFIPRPLSKRDNKPLSRTTDVVAAALFRASTAIAKARNPAPPARSPQENAAATDSSTFVYFDAALVAQSTAVTAGAAQKDFMAAAIHSPPEVPVPAFALQARAPQRSPTKPNLKEAHRLVASARRGKEVEVQERLSRRLFKNGPTPTAEALGRLSQVIANVRH